MKGEHTSVEFYLIDAFEIFHFLPLYYLFERRGIQVKFVAEPPESNTSGKWFDYDRAIEILEMNKVRYEKKCDPDCDFAFTTQESELLRKYNHKKVNTAYGFGFTNYSFLESERTWNGFDYKLVHGSITYHKLKEKGDIPQLYIMGYPKQMWEYPVVYQEPFDLAYEIKKQNTQGKPILVYFPTWDAGSSISAYWNEIEKLRKQFFIVTKAHHCTFRLRSEQEHRDILYQISDIVCGGNFDFKKVASVGDVAICDAISGAAAEVPLLNPNIDMLLLYSPLPEKNDFKKSLSEFSYCVKMPCEFMEGFYSVYQRDSYKEKRKEMLKKIFQPTDETCLEEFLNVLYQEKKRPNKQEKGVVHMRDKIWIWGTGNWTDRFIYLLGIQEDTIKGFIQSRKNKDVYRGKKVYEASEIKDMEYDLILVVSSFWEEIAEEADRLGMDRAKIVFVNQSKIGIRKKPGMKEIEYDWFNTENCGEWFIFDYGIFTNSHKLSERVKTVRSLADFWKDKNQFDTHSEIQQTSKMQSEMLQRYFIPNLRKEDVVCDFACASGEWSEFIAPYVGHLDGFDCSENMLATARKNMEGRQINNISYQYMDAEQTSFKRKYDHFLMLGLLTCIEDDTMASQIIKRVSDSIKSGGYLAVRDTLVMFETDKIYYNETDYSAVLREKSVYEQLYLENGFELIAEEYLNVYSHQPIEHGSHGYIFRKK